jgi:hypothetical protein
LSSFANKNLVEISRDLTSTSLNEKFLNSLNICEPSKILSLLLFLGWILNNVKWNYFGRYSPFSLFMMFNSSKSYIRSESKSDLITRSVIWHNYSIWSFCISRNSSFNSSSFDPRIRFVNLPIPPTFNTKDLEFKIFCIGIFNFEIASTALS